jgi:excisionase family DNA binding protein
MGAPPPASGASPPLLLTVAETAALLRTTPKAVYTMIERGRLDGVVRVGRRVLVNRERLMASFGARREGHARFRRGREDQRPRREVIPVVKVRIYRGSHDKWEVDIRFRWPDGTAYRERAKASVASKSGALRWGHAREVSLLAAGKPPEPVAPSPPPPDVPTLVVFAERVLAAARADRQKASSIAAKEMIHRRHLGPVADTSGSTRSRTRTWPS